MGEALEDELVRITIDLAQEELDIIKREAERQHRSRKDQLEYIIETWLENHQRQKK